MGRDLRPHLHPAGDALYLLASHPQRRPLMPCRGRASQRDTRRPGPGAVFAAPPPGIHGPGLCCPVSRLVVVLSLAGGAVLAAAVGRLKGTNTSEPMLFHSLHADLERDEVLLADRNYGSSWEVALLRGRGID